MIFDCQIFFVTGVHTNRPIYCCWVISFPRYFHLPAVMANHFPLTFPIILGAFQHVVPRYWFWDLMTSVYLNKLTGMLLIRQENSVSLFHFRFQFLFSVHLCYIFLSLCTLVCYLRYWLFEVLRVLWFSLFFFNYWPVVIAKRTPIEVIGDPLLSLKAFFLKYHMLLLIHLYNFTSSFMHI